MTPGIFFLVVLAAARALRGAKGTYPPPLPPTPTPTPPIITTQPPLSPPGKPPIEPPIPPHIPPHEGGHKTIRQGSQGPDVVAWQKFLGLPADGIFGPQTHLATVAWQKTHPPLVVDGIVGPKTWEMAEKVGPTTPAEPPIPPITSKPPPEPPIPPHIPPHDGAHKTIRNGSKGPDVVAWQKFLGLPADGIFGPQTVLATVAWQKTHPPLVADGIVGPKTWEMAEKVGPTTPAEPPIPPVTSKPPLEPPPTTQPPIPPNIPPSDGKRLTLRKGSTGADVVTWQNVLGVPADGKFGPGTHAATVAWQKARKLVADGIVGPKSWDMAESTPPSPISPIFKPDMPMPMAAPAPWPQKIPTDLPAFPAGWQPDAPPPMAVQSRAKQLLPELWKKGAGAKKVEKTTGRWITYRAEAAGKAKKKSVVAYRVRPGFSAPV
jgi:peptidoglycan hydrolase-like protein with peptidoglycan-binding domain